jgi:AcrR family transcriptional regulator
VSTSARLGGPGCSRREQARWRRERIIDAALAVFGRKGVEAASMKDLAAEAGVAPGLIYHYFTGKEALLLALITERGFLPELRRLLAERGEGPASSVLPEILAEFQRVLAERVDLLRILITGAATSAVLRAGLDEIVSEGRRLLAGYLAARVAEGELRSHDTTAVAGMLLGATAMARLVERPSDPEVLTEALLRGLAAGGPEHAGKEPRGPHARGDSSV